MSKYDEAIDKGIALLDEKVPDWCKKMQLDHLHMRDGKSCVLGQLYPTETDEEGYELNGFAVGCDALRIEHAGDYGFVTRFNEYGSLTRRWKKRIRQHCEAHE